MPLLALQLSHSERSFACAADLLGAFKAKEYCLADDRDKPAEERTLFPLEEVMRAFRVSWRCRAGGAGLAVLCWRRQVGGMWIAS